MGTILTYNNIIDDSKHMTGLSISGIITQVHASFIVIITTETVQMIGVSGSQMVKCIRVMWGS